KPPEDFFVHNFTPKNFQRYGLPLRVIGTNCKIHCPHTTLTQLPEDGVLADRVAFQATRLKGGIGFDARSGLGRENSLNFLQQFVISLTGFAKKRLTAFRVAFNGSIKKVSNLADSFGLHGGTIIRSSSVLRSTQKNGICAREGQPLERRIRY